MLEVIVQVVFWGTNLDLLYNSGSALSGSFLISREVIFPALQHNNLNGTTSCCSGVAIQYRRAAVRGACLAMAVCVPMASMVTMQPFKTSISRTLE